MKKENGNALNKLLILVISIIIVGVVIAMIFEKPQNSANTQNSIKNQNSINNSIDTQNSVIK